MTKYLSKEKLIHAFSSKHENKSFALFIISLLITTLRRDIFVGYIYIYIYILARVYVNSVYSGTLTTIWVTHKSSDVSLLFTIGLMSRVFASDSEDRGSIPGRVHTRLQKWYLIPPCLTLSIIRYGSRVKWSNPGNGITPSPIPQCGNYWKGSLRVTIKVNSTWLLNWNK